MRPRRELATLPFGAGVVIADCDGGRLYAYNESAGRVWRVLENGGSAGDAAVSLIHVYGLSSPQAEDDVASIITHWRERGMFEGRDPVSMPEPADETAPRSVACPERRFYCRICGKPLEIVAAEEAVLRYVETHLAPFFADNRERVPGMRADEFVIRSTESRDWVLIVNGAERLRSCYPWEITGALNQALLEAVYDCSDWLALIHGAAVAADNGMLLIAGRSGSGKSTLTAYLSAAGFGYAADDLAALRAPDGHLLPWPLPQSLKPGSWCALSQAIPELDALPAVSSVKGAIKLRAASVEAWALEPSPVRAILFPTYEKDAPAELQSIAPLEALQRLLEDRLWLGYPLDEAKVKRFLGWLEHVPAYALRYGDSSAAHALLCDHAL